MKKTIRKEVEKTYHVCDLCGNATESLGSVDSCWLCRREVCYRCRTLLFSGESSDLIDFAIKVCKQCQQHALLKEKVQAILDGANHELRKWMDLWKKAAEIMVRPVRPEDLPSAGSTQTGS